MTLLRLRVLSFLYISGKDFDFLLKDKHWLKSPKILQKNSVWSDISTLDILTLIDKCSIQYRQDSNRFGEMFIYQQAKIWKTKLKFKKCFNWILL